MNGALWGWLVKKMFRKNTKVLQKKEFDRQQIEDIRFQKQRGKEYHYGCMLMHPLYKLDKFHIKNAPIMIDYFLIYDMETNLIKNNSNISVVNCINKFRINRT